MVTAIRMRLAKATLAKGAVFTFPNRIQKAEARSKKQEVLHMQIQTSRRP